MSFKEEWTATEINLTCHRFPQGVLLLSLRESLRVSVLVLCPSRSTTGHDTSDLHLLIQKERLETLKTEILSFLHLQMEKTHSNGLLRGMAATWESVFSTQQYLFLYYCVCVFMWYYKLDSLMVKFQNV